MNDLSVYQISSYYPPHIGGMETFVQHLASNLSKKKYRVKVITSNIGVKKPLFSKPFLEVEYLPSKEILNTPLSWKFYEQLMKAPKNSIFHLHVAQAFLPEITYLVARRKSIPLISHIHLDVGGTSKIGSLILPLYKSIFLKHVLLHSDVVVVQNEDYRQKMHVKYAIPLEKMKVIPNGITLIEKHQPLKDIHPPYKLLFVGRLVNQKRVDILLQVAQELKRKKIVFHLDIVGDGPDFNGLLSQRDDLDLTKEVRFCGSLSPEEVGQKYLSSDCLIQTSERESFSTVLLEALNYGCPIVATDIAGTRNILIHKKDSLLSSMDPVKIAVNVERMLFDEKLRKKIIEQGYDTVAHYGWESVMQKIENMYSKINKL